FFYPNDPRALRGDLYSSSSSKNSACTSIPPRSVNGCTLLKKRELLPKPVMYGHALIAVVGFVLLLAAAVA
ncbi:MAG TPA: hypothetical protein VFS24_01645, partial [Steroidobacteraceae bacterium]|nr:hypothetical protein [Steroidobacteraceae bacterium]